MAEPASDPRLPDKKKRPNEALRYTGIAMQMAVIIGVGVYAGRWLDAWQGTEKAIFTVITSLLAVGVALYVVIKDLNR